MSCVTCAINDLPTKVLVNIFSYISFSDRKCAGLVNKKWFLASNQPIFLEKVQVHLCGQATQRKYQGRSSDSGVTMKTFFVSQRQFVHYFIEHYSFDHALMLMFLKKLSFRVKSLTLNRCIISSSSLVHFLEEASYLESLELDQLIIKEGEWDAADFAQLSSSQPLNVVYFRWCDAVRFIPDDYFNAIVKHMPKLQKLSLCLGQEDSRDELFHKRFMAAANRGDTNNCLKVVSLERFLKERSGTLKVLEIDQYTVVQPYIEHLLTIKLPNLKLEELYLINCMLYFDATKLNAFLKLQPNLKKLSLRGMPTSNTTLKVISQMEHLEDLTIQQKHMTHETRIADTGMCSIKSLRKIKKLDLANFFEVTDRGFNRGLMQLDFEKIESFQFANFAKLSRAAFNAMFVKMVNLTELTIVYSADYLNNKSMQLIFQHLVKLTVLTLEQSPNVTEAGFGYQAKKTNLKTYGIDRLPNLRKAAFSQFHALNDRCLELISSKTLTEIDLTECPFITFAGIKKVFTQCPMLETIILIENGHLPAEKIVQFAKTSLKRFKRILFVPNCVTE